MRVIGQSRSDRDENTRIRRKSMELGAQMGTSSANAIRAGGRFARPQNRPDIRLQSCLLTLHAHELLAIAEAST